MNNRILLIAAVFHFCTSSRKRQLKKSPVDTKLKKRGVEIKEHKMNSQDGHKGAIGKIFTSCFLLFTYLGKFPCYVKKLNT